MFDINFDDADALITKGKRAVTKGTTAALILHYKVVVNSPGSLCGYPATRVARER